MKSNKYWFKSKRFGWGFVPTSWEGWLMTFLFLGLIWLSAYLNGINKEPISKLKSMSFFFDMILVILISIPLFQSKSKDKARWRWGR